MRVFLCGAPRSPDQTRAPFGQVLLGRATPEGVRVPRRVAGKRQIVEGLVWQLKDLFGLERHRAKTLGGLLARLAAKVALAYQTGG